jgi:hypothetical protein
VTLAQWSPFPMSAHIFAFYMHLFKISFLMPLVQKNFILIFQIFTPHACTFASTITRNVRRHIFLEKKSLYNTYPRLIDTISKDHDDHIAYAVHNLTWHCKNTPLSASSQLRDEIINFSLYRPDLFFASTRPGRSLFFYVPEFLRFVKALVCPIFFACPIWYIERME